MNIGIVTVLYKSDPVIDAFIECMNNQVFENFHVLFVENNVENGYCEKVITEKAAFGYTFVRNKENVGVAAANNQGIDFFVPDLEYTHILFLNNDIEVEQDFLKMHKDMFLQHNEVDALAPKMFYHGTNNKIWYAGGALSYLKGGVRHFGHNKSDNLIGKELYKITYAPTCSLMIKADILRRTKIRMWDELFVYADDYVFCHELHNADVQMYYSPLITLQHKISTSTGGASSAFSRYYVVRNWFYIGLLWQNFAVLGVAPLRAITWLFSGRTIELRALYDGFRLAVENWAMRRGR